MKIVRIFHILLLLFACSASASLLAQPKETADKIQILSSREDALDSRLWLLGKAEKEILITYYIFEDDGLGMLVLQELLLLKQKKPSLEIKIIVDASANKLSSNLIHYLSKNGIIIKEYHPFPKIWLPLSHVNIKGFFTSIKNANYRMHDKLFIVDRKYFITGGRNIEESYFGMNEKNFYDLDIFVHSHTESQRSAAYFDNMWNSSRVQVQCPAIDYSQKNDYEEDIIRFNNLKTYINENEDYLEVKSNLKNYTQSAIKITSGEFLHCFSNEEQDFVPKKLSQELYELAAKTERELIIETPYLLYTDRFFDLLKSLREKNVNVIFVTNSVCSTDMVAVAGAYDVRKKKLLEIGVELYEYTGNNYMHSKTAIIDGTIGMVGSYNMDPRSAYFNTESVFMFTGKEAVHSLRTIIEGDKENCNRISLENGDIVGNNFDCKKPVFDWIIYLFNQLFSHVKWIYNLL